MGFLKKLLTPSVPSITDTDAVVEWFFNYDEKIADVKDRVPQPHLDNLKIPISQAVRESASAEELQLHIDDASTTYDTALQTLYQFHQVKESEHLPEASKLDEVVDNAAKAAVLEACASAMLRIYGYFMLNRFNEQPRVDRPTHRADPNSDFAALAEAAEQMRNALAGGEDDPDLLLLRHALPSDIELRKCLALAAKLDQPFWEILFVRLFTLDFAILNAYATHQGLQDKRDLHHGMWAKLMTDDVTEAYNQRFMDYSEAMVKTKQGQSVAEVLGRAFAATCVCQDLAVVLEVSQFVQGVLLEHVELLRALPDAKWTE